ncbi:hypothetical protein L2719_08435 [Shewanella schlegeliana]|uniref:DUF2946 domain-containing protein n=1 Tax=Shewanella schlegeliana TaxID=190308 RepID=A0ABS1T1R8_9GAMM|nr:hypothetical protein [Shewanella schlegeliana]MBL4914619.1 hypothetical protein [Shewanella schlegeliana]MCL1109565.1 hypothetical protein [Shewanella schlegeliana]GIU29723.1 hypothetical protein TUM4433_19320 [Shewanella schlegeliana]
MRKQVIYLAFFIALIGQFILSPAMAMPKFLHASSHASQHIKSHASLEQSKALAANTSSAQHATDSLLADSQMNCTSKMPNLNLANIDCDALCEMLGASDCISSCVSAPGIVEQEQLMLIAQSSMASLQTAFWSLQTAELSSINPPPISLLA